MRALKKTYKAWAIRHVNEGRRYFLGRYFDRPAPAFEGSETLLFKTRLAARVWLSKRFGYIRKRKDLRSPPFNWKMPVVVRVIVTVKEEK